MHLRLLWFYELKNSNRKPRKTILIVNGKKISYITIKNHLTIVRNKSQVCNVRERMETF